MSSPTKFLIDGVDRLGKSTLIQNIQDELGYHLVIHYDKPKVLRAYDYDKAVALRRYQAECNLGMFQLIESKAKIIFDRTHLGELVYAPIYRDYSGEYVLEWEKMRDTSDCRLIVLYTSDMNVGEDDGGGFDWNKRESEQDAFLEAFSKSSIRNKHVIDVSNGQGGYRDQKEILEEALSSVQTKTYSL